MPCLMNRFDESNPLLFGAVLHEVVTRPPFTARIKRARRAPALSFLSSRWPVSGPTCARRTTIIMISPSSLVPSQGWGLIDLPLRASNEGSPRPRVARAQKIIRLHPPFCSASIGTDQAIPLPPLFEHLPKPRLNMAQPFAQIALKNIGLGLRCHALGLDLILEQDQLGE